MTTLDLVTGWSLIVVTSLAYIYYTIWIIVLPFVDKDQLFHKYFPDQKYALGFPLLAGSVGLLTIGIFVLFTCRRPKKKLN